MLNSTAFCLNLQVTGQVLKKYPMYGGDEHSMLDVRFNTALVNNGHAITFWHVHEAKAYSSDV